jgi:hypothetical protein
MENGCLARMNLIGTRGKPETVSGVPLKGLRLEEVEAPRIFRQSAHEGARLSALRTGHLNLRRFP